MFRKKAASNKLTARKKLSGRFSLVTSEIIESMEFAVETRVFKHAEIIMPKPVLKLSMKSFVFTAKPAMFVATKTAMSMSPRTLVSMEFSMSAMPVAAKTAISAMSTAPALRAR